METMNRNTGMILAEAFKDCPHIGVINLELLLDKQYGISVSQGVRGERNNIYNDGPNAEECLRIYENSYKSSENSVNLRSIIGNTDMGHLLKCAKSIDGRAKKNKDKNTSGINGYYIRDIDSMAARFTELIHSQPNAKMIVFYMDHDHGIASISNLITNVARAAFDAITTVPIIYNFRIQIKKDTTTELIILWLTSLADMSQVCTSAVRTLEKLIVEYCVDEYFVANLQNLNLLIRYINEEKDSKYCKVHARDIVDSIGDPKDLITRIPIFIKSADKATRYEYDPDNGTDDYYVFKPRAIYNSIIYDICVKSMQAKSINDMITNGIISFRRIMRVIKRTAFNVKIVGSLMDVLVISNLIYTCSESINAEELICNE